MSDKTDGVQVIRRDGDGVWIEGGTSWRVVGAAGELTVFGTDGEVLADFHSTVWAEVRHSPRYSSETGTGQKDQKTVAGRLDISTEEGRREQARVDAVRLARMQVSRRMDDDRAIVSGEAYLAELLHILDVPDPGFVAARLVRDGGVKAP